MKYYILDTSAYVYALEKGTGNINVDFITETENDNAFLYMPQFCVTEVLNTISKLRYSEEIKSQNKQIDQLQFKKLYDFFIEQIHDRKLIYIYDLHRYHNLNAGLEEYGGCDIYRANWDAWNSWDKGWQAKKKDKTNKPPLGAPDILIIAMTIELKKIHKKDDVVVLTNDRLLAKVINGFQSKFNIRSMYLTEK